MNNNPIIFSDFPDPDVIRVKDTYYMISTTMHFIPGGVILRSFDLIHWEILTHVFEELDNTPGQKLENNLSIYGKGMWAASLRYHKGTFYICFVANDTRKTYLYRAEDITGPWRKQNISGFYHDCSLLFDEDDRVYIVYGNKEIYLTELNEDLTGPKMNGLHRMVARDSEDIRLGYEGSHMYKIKGKYYLFFIHWLSNGNGRRVEACFVSDSLEGEFAGRDILDDDMGYHNAGVAQGGIVDTPDGDWYALLFQDHGAIGRIPVLVPMHWENDFPVFGVDGKIPSQIEVKSTRAAHVYTPLTESDDFYYKPGDKGKVSLKKSWEWNHTPNHELWSVTERPGALRLRTGKISPNVGLAVNTLTQRMTGPACEMLVTVDGSGLKNGDFAGICALQGCYGLIGLTKEDDKYYLVMIAKEMNPEESIWGEEGGDKKPGREFERIPFLHNKVTLKVQADFKDGADTAEFYYQDKGQWNSLGIKHRLYFRLDHFTGCRVGLFLYATKETGGTADFENFLYQFMQSCVITVVK